MASKVRKASRAHPGRTASKDPLVNEVHRESRASRVSVATLASLVWLASQV